MRSTASSDVHHRAHDEHRNRSHLLFGEELVGRAGCGFVRVLAGHLHVAAKRAARRCRSRCPRGGSSRPSGLNPSWNVSTRTPRRWAARKWPSSCTNTSTPRTNANDSSSRHTVSLDSIVPREQIPARYSRAQRSTARTAAPASRPSTAGGPPSLVSMTSAIDVNLSRPSEKRGDGHLVGRVQHDRQAASAASARYARSRHGKALAIGQQEVEPRRLRAGRATATGPPTAPGTRTRTGSGSRMSVTPSCAIIDPSQSAPPSSARPTADGRRRRSDRRARRTASAPRSPRGPCSSAWPNRS